MIRFSCRRPLRLILLVLKSPPLPVSHSVRLAKALPARRRQSGVVFQAQERTRATSWRERGWWNSAQGITRRTPTPPLKERRLPSALGGTWQVPLLARCGPQSRRVSKARANRASKVAILLRKMSAQGLRNSPRPRNRPTLQSAPRSVPLAEREEYFASLHRVLVFTLQ
jgi:hypothetical protein